MHVILVDSLRHERLELFRGVVRDSSPLSVSLLLVLDVVLRVRILLTEAHGGKAPRLDVNVRATGCIIRHRPRLVISTIDPDDLLHPGH